MRTLLRLCFSATAAAAFVVACGGHTSGPPNGTGTGNVCDDYFQALFGTGCIGGQRPADDLSRLEARWGTVCQSALALPGQGITDALLESCSAAVQAGGCAAMNGSACNFTPAGTLAAGSACQDNSQCQSASCSTVASSASCGTCNPTIPVGQRCNGSGCGAGAACSSIGGPSTCQAITYGASGEACDGYSRQCNEGLACRSATHTCVTPGGAGAACGTTTDCAPPLVCPTTQGSPSTCQQPGAAGAPCLTDNDCAPSFGCATSLRQCAAITWVAAGQPCSETARCLAGNCPYGPTGPSGACPTVIADGQPCTLGDAATTCDIFAQCLAGTCRLGYDQGCK
jgi:hypothetical protein